MKKDSAKEVSLWQFLSQHEIMIPKIQRDYAQGREDKTELRRSFLKDIKESIDSCSNTARGGCSPVKEMKMDFVYGSKNTNFIEPLDGQQRLTTLWLLHWYIALKAGLLDNNENNIIKETLKRFTYQTRVSSRVFCEKLCDKGAKSWGDNLKESITTQTWFCSAWLQDPTIQAMLRMLCGTKDKKGKPAQDGIEQIFKDNDEDDFQNFWKILTSESCPIKFYYLDLIGLKLTDDLYIKMNARGKPLSSFENFKADLIGYIAAREGINENWKKFNDIKEGFPIKLDTSWAEIFWKANKDFWKSHLNNQEESIVEFHIDDSYFAFFNRVFLNLLITEKQEKVDEDNQDDEEKAYLFKVKELDSANNYSFNYLYGPKDDTHIKYTSFDYYCYKPNANSGNMMVPEEIFQKILNILDNLGSYTNENLSTNEYIRTCFPERHQNSSFEFIPTYRKENNIVIDSISQRNRVVFFCICKYLEQGQFEEKSFKQWMRVAWNIIDATEINTVDSMVGRIRRIDKIASHTHDIYNYLKECDPFTRNGQLEEERIKAKYIIDEKTEDKLIEAENFSFFKGSIRFLYQDEKGNTDWSLFDTKYESAKSKFEELSPESTNATLMKKLFSYMDVDDFNNTLWWCHCVFNNKDESWRYLLLNEKLYRVINHFLLDEDVADQEEPVDENQRGYILYHLSHGKLLDFVMKKIPNSWIRDNYHYHTAIYPSTAGVFLNAKKRNHFLLNSSEITVKEDHKVEGTEFLYGNDINFEFENKNFQWNDKDEIILIDNNGNSLKFSTKDKDMDKDTIIYNLKNITKN